MTLDEIKATHRADAIWTAHSVLNNSFGSMPGRFSDVALPGDFRLWLREEIIKRLKPKIGVRFGGTYTDRPSNITADEFDGLAAGTHVVVPKRLNDEQANDQQVR